MVFLSALNFVCKNGVDRTLRKQKILKLSAKYFGRRRNCYSIAIKFVQKALRYTTVGRKIKPEYLSKLRQTRVDAACAELDTNQYTLRTNLIKCNINIGTEMLKELAIWEPRTFKCLTEIARVKEKLEVPDDIKENFKVPDNVITRGML